MIIAEAQSRTVIWSLKDIRMPAYYRTSQIFFINLFNYLHRDLFILIENAPSGEYTMADEIYLFELELCVDSIPCFVLQKL